VTADVCPDMGMISCTTFPPSLQTSGDFPCRRHRVRHHITHSQCSKAYRCRVSDHRRRRLSGSSAERPSRQSGTMGTAPAGFVICTFTSGIEAILAAGPSLRRLEICPKGPYDLKISLAQSSTSASFASSFPWTVFYISTFACWPEDRWASRGSSFVAPLR